MALLLALITAHLFADFWLQPSHWVEDKRQQEWRSHALIKHSLVHGLAALIAAASINVLSSYELAWVMVIITLSHYLIDLSKVLYLKHQHTPSGLSQLVNSSQVELRAFIIDQILHVAVIVGLVIALSALEWSWPISTSQTLLLIVSFILLTTVSGIIVRLFTQRWRTLIAEGDPSLDNAGTLIGYLERLFIFGFILMGEMTLIGFVLAAKSILRLSQVKDTPNHRPVSEYILIGTLVSFGLAILISYAYLWILSQL